MKGNVCEEEVFRCLQDRKLLLSKGFGVEQALTSNWKQKGNWTFSAGGICLHQRYSAGSLPVTVVM